MERDPRRLARGEDLLRLDEAPVGTSEVGVLASKALRALTRASRACLLYDFDNEAVADFLRELELRMDRILAHGPLELVVQPWELVRAGEVVYRERDREKSLAFRLYYDGVRGITVHPRVTWDEIIRLVGILSLRFLGIRQQEDDVVTLLWKADLEHIDVESVEGYTPLDDESAHEAPFDAQLAIREQLYPTLADDRLPRPQLADTIDVSYRSIDPDQVGPLRAEEGPEALPKLCLRLVDQLMVASTRADDPVSIELGLPVIREIRDFLLADNRGQELLEAVRLVHLAAQQAQDSAARSSMLAVFTDREAFARMVDAAFASDQVPQALVEVLSVAPIDELDVLLQVLASRWTGPVQESGRQVLQAALGDRVRQIGDLIVTAPVAIAGDLLEIAADREPEFTVLLAVAMVRREDRSSRLKALDLLKNLPYRSEVGRVLIDFGLAATDSEVRAKSADVLAVKGEKRAFSALARAIEIGLEQGAHAPQLEPLADALTRIDPAHAVTRFSEWIRPEGLLHRVRATPGPIWRVAVGCLARIPESEARELLRWMHSRTDGDLKARCVQAMAQQKELMKRG